MEIMHAVKPVWADLHVLYNLLELVTSFEENPNFSGHYFRRIQRLRPGLCALKTPSSGETSELPDAS